MTEGKFEIRWLDRGHPPRQPPNPFYHDGCHVDLTERGRKIGLVKRRTPSPETAEPSCVVELPYPCPHANVGTWMIRCLTCDLRVGITAASRPDDARSARLQCKARGHG